VHEKIAGLDVVHNYGHGGFGYQTSWGCAEDVVGIVKRVLGERGEGSRVRAKL
jgi:D-amino-acid oxidase